MKSEHKQNVEGNKLPKRDCLHVKTCSHLAYNKSFP